VTLVVWRALSPDISRIGKYFVDLAELSPKMGIVSPSPARRVDRSKFLAKLESDSVSAQDRRGATVKLISALRAAANFLIRIPERTARILVRGYRMTLSPLVGFHCRHLPTCSDYSEQAFARFGFWAGGWMTLARLCRCHPWGTSGLDFVPERLPERARWYLPWRYARWRGTQERPADDDRHRHL
jgi:uncharacterized protein